MQLDPALNRFTYGQMNTLNENYGMKDEDDH